MARPSKLQPQVANTVDFDHDGPCELTSLAERIRSKRMQALREYQKYSRECDRQIQALETTEAETVVREAEKFLCEDFRLY